MHDPELVLSIATTFHHYNGNAHPLIQSTENYRGPCAWYIWGSWEPAVNQIDQILLHRNEGGLD